MDTIQLLLSTAVTITTILLIIVSVQLVSLLKHLKSAQIKESYKTIKKPEIEKNKTGKRVSMISILGKMKSHISRGNLSPKTFFKSN